MLEKNQQFGVYTIKEILYADGGKTCCLTEDPFFHSSVILNVVAIETLEIAGQRRDLANNFDKLHLLEHPGIAAIYDSGFEGDFFYYTTSYNHQESLADLLTSQPYSESSQLLTELADCLAYATEQGVNHGPVRAEDIHFNDKGRALIADFGVAQCFALLSDDKSYSTQISESLTGLGEFLLQLLSGASDCAGRESELLEQLEEQPLKKTAADLLGLGERSFASFDELCAVLRDEQLSAAYNSAEEDAKVEPEQLQSRDDGTISVREKKEVLPQVRQLINEKNQLILMLDKASLEKNRISNQLSQARQTIDALENQQEITAVDDNVNVNRSGRLLLFCALCGFVFGLFAAGFWGGPANDGPLQSATVVAEALPEPTADIVPLEEPLPEPVAKDVVKVAEVVEAVEAEVEAVQVAQQVDIIEEPLVAAEPIVVDDNDDSSSASATLEAEPSGWWPAGQEFSEEASFSEKALADANSSIAEDSAKISVELRADVLEILKGWADAWSRQDAQDYLEYYSADYFPSSGSSRAQWAADRARKLQRPEWIKINIDNIRLERQEDQRLWARFEQSYRSNSYQDLVSKELELVLDTGQWKIVREKNKPL